MHNQNENEDRRQREAGDWLLRLGEDSLSDGDVAAWVEWCESDAENLRAFESLQALWAGASEHSPRPEQLARLLQADPLPADRTVVAAWRRGHRRYRAAAGLAMAASLVVAVAVTALFSSGRDASSGMAPLQVATRGSVETAVATNRHATLPDGSGIDVGGRSVIDVDFSASQRQLRLRDGEAYFQVRHDRKHPFVVNAGRVQVLAVGTAFDVRRAGSEVTVTVREGTVRVSRIADDQSVAVPPAQDPLKGEIATAGYQLVVDTASGSIRRSVVDADAVLAWRSGRLEFAGDSLDTVLANVNRYSARPILLADPQLGHLSFTGTVFFGSIDAWLDGLQQVFPLTVDRSAPDRIVIGKGTAGAAVAADASRS